MKRKYIEDLISVIMPAYKAEKYIAETINSVLLQTYKNWELIIIDDCSPDKTTDIVKSYATKNKQIKLISLSKNNGPANARNAGLERANGLWIAFLDSDDLWHPKKLEHSIKYAKKNNYAFIHTGFKRINESNTQTGHYISVPMKMNYSDLLGNTAIATSTVLINRSICGDIKMQDVYYDDFVCWLGILKKGGLAYGLDEDLMRYRVVNHSVSRDKKRSALKVWETYRTIEKLNLIRSTWCFCRYAVNAYLKYRKF